MQGDARLFLWRGYLYLILNCRTECAGYQARAGYCRVFCSVRSTARLLISEHFGRFGYVFLDLLRNYTLWVLSPSEVTRPSMIGRRELVLQKLQNW